MLQNLRPARACAAAAGLAAVLSTVPPARLLGQSPPGQARYLSHAELTAALQKLARTHPARATLVEIGKTRGGRTIQAIQIAAAGGAPVETRPGVLVVAALEGDGLLGSALALAAADELLSSTDARLAASVFYIVPRVNADGVEAWFEAVKSGRRTNLTPFDDDNDGRVDEDGPEDLNQDGMITMMRVKDPAGPYGPHASEPRLMIEADATKGEAGGWQVYWEGVDNDGDGFYNEDGVGGTDLDRNFPHQYPYHTPDAGRHMVSEPESRALMDFVIARRNIAAILTLGTSDNLVSSPNARGELGRGATIDLIEFAREATTAARAAGIVRDAPPTRFFAGGPIDGSEFAPPPRPAAPPRPPARRPALTVNTADIELFRHVGERYRELTGIRQLTAARRPAGAFFEWGYFQFGVPSFSTPGWGSSQPARDGGQPDGAAGSSAPADPAAAAAPAAPGPAPAGPPASASGPGGGRGPGSAGAAAGSPGGTARGPGAAGDGAGARGTAADDLRTLRWLEREQVDAFVPWVPFTHPTLGAVEIGGFRPYAIAVPPADTLPALAKAHTAFVLEIAGFLPRLAIADARAAALGGGLHRIAVIIENRGRWPTALLHGVTARAVKPVMVQLGVDPSAIVSGAPKTNFLPALAGSGRQQRYEWIVKGTAGQRITVRAVAQKGGSVSETVTLR